jgi:hypothetical protein
MFFEGATEQYIDDKGKTRLLNFENITLMTSPIPPLNLKVVIQKKIIDASLQTALDFIEPRGLEIVSKDGNETEGIQGLWVKSKDRTSGLYYGYIPLIVSKEDLETLKNVEFTDINKNNPIRTDAEEYSELSQFRRSRQTAEFLKSYTLYSYALSQESGDVFDENNFTILPGHEYDIDSLGKRMDIKNNPVMFSKGKLIVTSPEMRDRLLAYLKVSILNNEPGIKNLIQKPHLSNARYQTISDFRSTDGQLIFTNTTGIARWIEGMKKSKYRKNISQYLRPDIEEPYFYRSLRIKQNQLVIIQNVAEGDISNAKIVSMKWAKDRVNIGYDLQIKSQVDAKKVDSYSYTIYTEKGIASDIKKKSKETASVILYDDGSYGAILFLA